MAYRDWTRRGYVQGDTVEIIIRDDRGKKIEVFKFIVNDRRAHKEAGRVLRLKYGVHLTDLVKEKQKKDTDIDWLKQIEE